MSLTSGVVRISHRQALLHLAFTLGRKNSWRATVHRFSTQDSGTAWQICHPFREGKGRPGAGGSGGGSELLSHSMLKSSSFT